MLKTTVLWTILIFVSCDSGTQNPVTKYVRCSLDGEILSGILQEDVIYELDGDIYSSPKKTGREIPMSDVTLLPPCIPSKVLAVGLNFKSHLGERPIPEYPGLFSKYPTSVAGPKDVIEIPNDATNLHYEGEMVIVIGKKASKVSVEDARNYVFGVTAGNDLSERDWQSNDLQWLRAKASDGFGPIGPVIATGLDPNNLLLQTRLNGQIVQSENTKDLIYNVEQIVSYISQYVTLFPGDIIFTGTPQTTQAISSGDVIEVELEGVGVLSNTFRQSTN